MTTRILLVTTSFEEILNIKAAKSSEIQPYPVGLAYLHSYLESKKNQVRTLNLNHSSYKECLEKVIENIEKFSPEIIGIQVLTATRVSTYKIVDYLCKNFPKIKIVFGGIHATIMHQQLIKKYPFTICVLGEGELTMQELSKEILKRKPNFKKIDGIAYFDKKLKIPVRTKRRELIKDLNTLPFPIHELFLKNKKMVSASILTSRGCPFACSFCCLNPEAKRIVRFRSPKNVVDEIEYIGKNFPHIKEVFIHDDSFFIDNQRVIKICKEILKRKIKMNFTCSGRMKPLSEEMVKILEKAGFTHVLLGLESGSREILKSCGKGITPEDVIRAFKLFKKTSINPKVFLIVGLPGETIHTIKETIKLVRKIQKINYLLMGHVFNLLTIYPGTGVYEIAKKKGFIEDSYWLSDKETPIYTAENSYKKLKSFEKIMSDHLSIYKIKTLDGFLLQLEMLPYAFKYFLKKVRSIKILKRFIKETLLAKNEF